MNQSKDRSAGVAFALTLVFGPLGLLYVTVPGGIILTVIAAVSAFFTLGLSLLAIWPLAMVWGTVAASNRHSRFERELRGSYEISTAERAELERKRQQWQERDQPK